MPPKAEITKDKILDRAFEVVREEGIDALTARRIAEKLKCSTQPIYSVYGNMEEVKEEVYHRAVDFALSIMRQYEDAQNEPCMNLALGSLVFAKNEKQLFRTVFLSDQRRNYLAKHNDKVKEELYAAFLRLDSRFGVFGEARLEQMFKKIFIFIIGTGTLINTDCMEWDIDETTKMIERLYQAILNDQLIRW